MKLEGELREIDLIAKLIELSDERFTGAIRFEDESAGVIKIIYFKDGNVLSASTNDRTDSIDEILLRSSKVSKEHIKQALARRKENETLGDALLALGFITRKELAWVRRVQLIGIVRSLQRWETGSYTIVSDYLPKREEGTIFNLPQIIVEVIVTEQDRSRIEADLGGSDRVFARTPNAEERYRALGLNEDADTIYQRIDGATGVSEIAAGSGMDEFSVFKLVQAFKVLGVVQLADVPIPKAQVLDEVSLDFSDAPVLPLASSGVVTPRHPVPDEESMTQTLSLDASDWNTDPADTTAPILQMDTLDLGYTTELENSPGGNLSLTTPLPVSMATETMKPRPPLPSGPSIAPRRDVVPPSAVFDDRAPMFAHIPQQRPAPMKRRRFPVAAVLIALLIGSGALGAWWFFTQRESTPAAASTPAPSNTTTAPTVAASTGTIVESDPPAAETTSQAVTTAPFSEPTPTMMSEQTPDPATGVAPTTPGILPPAAAPVTPVAPVVPSRSAGVEPARAQTEQMARDFAAESASVPYSVQIAFLCEVRSVQNAVESGGSSVWFVPVERGGRTCFRVFYGRYGNRTDAQRGVSGVPAAFRAGNRPVVVRVADVVRR